MEKLFFFLISLPCIIVIYQERKKLKEAFLTPFRKKGAIYILILAVSLTLAFGDGNMKIPSVKPLTHLGNAIGNGKKLLPAIIMGICLTFITKLEKAETALRRALISGIAAGAIADIIKIGTLRARPRVGNKLDWFRYDKITDSDYWSFPSGHTALASGVFFSLYLSTKGAWRYIFLPFPFIVAISRVAVGAHWFSDVVFSLLIGFIIAIGGDKREGA